MRVLPTSIKASLMRSLMHPRAAARAAWLAPLVTGLFALLLGQDTNWDLLNYHFYNPYALLNDRVGIDLAAAQFQSYFNPLLDLPYYAMVSHWPAMAAGFAMGAAHGLNFVLLLCIVRLVLDKRDDATAIMLSLAGCLGPAFLSQLGNTMGDNSTAPFVLAALALVIWQQRQITDGRWLGRISAVAGGLLMGAGVGLKLTNAVYAVALCLTLLTLPVLWWRRVWMAFLFGLGVLGGIAVTSGYWFVTLWKVFGNPLFPQFNAWFGAPLAASITIVDMRWLPKSAWEALLFPFVFIADPRRVSELPVWPFIWPVVWVLMIWWAGLVVLRKSSSELSASARLVVLFVGLAFAIWMGVFSIYRYAVPMEMLAPLVVWLLAHQLLAGDNARRFAALTLALVAVTSVVTVPFWSHSAWDSQAFRVEVPPLPASGTIVLINSEEPNSWMVPFFPPKMAVVGIATNFPEGPAFRARVHEIIRQSGGKVWGVMPALSNERAARVATRVARLNDMLAPMALSGSGWPCRGLSAIMERVSRSMRVTKNAYEGRCRLESLTKVILDSPEANSVIAQHSAKIMTRYGLLLDIGSCLTYEAWVGAKPLPYQLCEVALRAGSSNLDPQAN